MLVLKFVRLLVRLNSSAVSDDFLTSLFYRVADNITVTSIDLSSERAKFKQRLVKSYHQQIRLPKYSFPICYKALSPGVYLIIAQVPITRHLLSL